MRDGSLLEDQKTPSDFDFNVKVTKETVEIAHAHGVSVEGELGCLGSLETGMGEQEDGVGAEEVLSHDQLLTDPDEAEEFVRETQVDALAIAIGTSHGAYKFTRPPTGDTLAIDRIKEINKKLPSTHLVMHGSSSVPQDLIKTINEFGGKIKETYGVPISEIQEGIKNGVRKINIDTDLRLASTAAIRKHFHNDPSQFDPRKYLLDSKDGMKVIVKQRLEEFGTAGNASKIKPKSLSVMSQLYSDDKLSQKIY
jgi:fructose-bisphosphate aldolase class II